MIGDLSGSRHLMRSLDLLYDQESLAIRAAAAWPGHIDQGHREHLEILRAIEDRDDARAEAAMRAHFVRTRPQREVEANKQMRSLTKTSRGGST